MALRLLAVGDYLKLRVYCLNASPAPQLSVNTTYWRVWASVGPPAYTSQDFAVKADAGLGPLYKDALSSLSEYRGVTAQVFRPIPLESVTVAAGGAGVGSKAAALLPTQSSAVMSYRTNDAKVRGRNYMPFPYAAAIDANGTPTAAYLALVDAILGWKQAGVVLNSIGGSTLNLAQWVYSPPVWDYSTTPRTLIRAEKFTEVSQWTKADKFGTQRRRGNYGKVNSSPI